MTPEIHTALADFHGSIHISFRVLNTITVIAAAVLVIIVLLFCIWLVRRK
jgi:hypothetical protein